MNTLAGEQHSGSAYLPDPHWRTKHSNRVSNFFAFFSFLSLQSVQCHTQQRPTTFILQNFISTTQNLIWRQTLQLLVTRFVFTNRSLVGLGTNYVGAQARDEMANGAFNFDMDAVGRRAADLCLMDIQKNFNGQIWVQNGPGVILRVLQTLCGTNRVSVRPVNKCFNPLARKFAFSYRTHLCFLPWSQLAAIFTGWSL